MRKRDGLASLILLATLAARAQQPAAPAASSTTPQQPAIVIYRIDLNPTGSVFAMNEPSLQGDTYVFTSLPERTPMGLPKSKVKAVVRWSTDVEKEVVWRIDVEPSGSYLAREEPVKKGSNWIVKAWKQGQLVSLPASDVKAVTRLVGREAYKAEMKELGVVVLEGETTNAGFKQTADAPGSAPSARGGAGPGNWTYQGTPGATDAYAPAGGTVSRPGDTPMAPTPH